LVATADHYPRLKMHGGHLTPDNVRLAHRPFALVVAPLLGLGLLWRIALTVSTHGRPIDAVVHTRQSHLLGPGGQTIRSPPPLSMKTNTRQKHQQEHQ
jgi:hypothetical protein